MAIGAGRGLRASERTSDCDALAIDRRRADCVGRDYVYLLLLRAWFTLAEAVVMSFGALRSERRESQQGG